MNVPRFQKSPIDTSVYFNVFKVSRNKGSYTRNIPIDEIRKIIYKHTGFDPYEEPTVRNHKMVWSRKLFFYFVRTYEGLTQERTAKLLGKDHVTVLLAVRDVILRRSGKDEDFRELFFSIEKSVRNMYKLKTYENTDKRSALAL